MYVGTRDEKTTKTSSKAWNLARVRRDFIGSWKSSNSTLILSSETGFLTEGRMRDEINEINFLHEWLTLRN